MKVYELRGKTRDELINDLNGLYKELFNLKIRHASKELPNPLKIRTIKREIARIITILREDELGRIKLLKEKRPQPKTQEKKGE